MKVVAIGTVADVAKLVGENRTIVTLGLKDLAKASIPDCVR
jgi:single-stranded DNA-specific DHH superfamily exonuclease